MAAPMGESLGIPYDVIHMYAFVHACTCAHVCGAPPSPHPPIPHLQGDPQNQ